MLLGALWFAVGLASRGPQVLLSAAAQSAPPQAGGVGYTQEHLIWQPGFGSRFGATLVLACAAFAGASLADAWGHRAVIPARAVHLVFRIDRRARKVMRECATSRRLLVGCCTPGRCT